MLLIVSQYQYILHLLLPSILFISRTENLILQFGGTPEYSYMVGTKTVTPVNGSSLED